MKLQKGPERKELDVFKNQSRKKVSYKEYLLSNFYIYSDLDMLYHYFYQLKAYFKKVTLKQDKGSSLQLSIAVTKNSI